MYTHLNLVEMSPVQIFIFSDQLLPVTGDACAKKTDSCVVKLRVSSFSIPSTAAGSRRSDCDVILRDAIFMPVSSLSKSSSILWHTLSSTELSKPISVLTSVLFTCSAIPFLLQGGNVSLPTKIKLLCDACLMV